MNDNSASTATPGSGAARWAGRLLIAGLALIILPWLLSRPGLIGPFPTMTGYMLGSLLLIIAAVLAIIAMVRGKGSTGTLTWAALIAGLLCIINTVSYVGGASGSAPIHDISTDTANPPQFDVVIALRAADNAPNPPEYAGPEAAELQAAAYPDIDTIVLRDPIDFVFESAVSVGEAMGWEIVAQDMTMNTGHIEATATTPFVGFKDDVVIRISTNGPETMVDVRSKSRIGGGDAGVNAKRIREFRERLVAFVEP